MSLKHIEIWISLVELRRFRWNVNFFLLGFHCGCSKRKWNRDKNTKRLFNHNSIVIETHCFTTQPSTEKEMENGSVDKCNKNNKQPIEFPFWRNEWTQNIFIFVLCGYASFTSVAMNSVDRIHFAKCILVVKPLFNRKHCKRKWKSKKIQNVFRTQFNFSVIFIWEFRF